MKSSSSVISLSIINVTWEIVWRKRKCVWNCTGYWTSVPQNKKCSVCNSNYKISNHFGRFLKKLADDQWSSKTKGNVYHANHATFYHGNSLNCNWTFNFYVINLHFYFVRQPMENLPQSFHINIPGQLLSELPVRLLQLNPSSPFTLGSSETFEVKNPIILSWVLCFKSTLMKYECEYIRLLLLIFSLGFYFYSICLPEEKKGRTKTENKKKNKKENIIIRNSW